MISTRRPRASGRVTTIAAAHGATITPKARPGGGLAVEVAFPAAPSPRSGWPRGRDAARV